MDIEIAAVSMVADAMVIGACMYVEMYGSYVGVCASELVKVGMGSVE